MIVHSELFGLSKGKIKTIDEQREREGTGHVLSV
jgi:hypothetical protein